MLTIWTYDWVPEGPRGYVRDLRLRWACEEAQLAYEVRSVSFDEREPEHFARQPFGQIPFLEDNGLTLFESGACLLHLGRKSDTLMPRDPAAEAEVLEWTIAALNSIEMVSVPLMVVGRSSEGGQRLAGWLAMRLAQLETVIESREWIAAERFTVADILMADVLRQTKAMTGLPGDYPTLEAYIERVCARPAFGKAHADQLAHFAAGDEARLRKRQ
ncbi:glutathione S-transferase family protein [Rubellimicrobium roseum]|uniref:glutathione S-transferase family protein n=1 Tax=Rubellimicrobium roseum TaxID=687525 RepID=UPI001C3F2C8C|nr:glutathione S-transferase family protein [Rubellimicrobium roseum]